LLPQAAFTSGTTIESAKVNSDFSDIASALTQSVSKDGQTTLTGNLPFGGFKGTGLGAASGSGESVRYDEFKAAFRSLLVGLGMSNNVSPNTKVDVAAGSWTEVGQGTVLANVAGTIDCGTTGANGLDAGSLANSTWYHAFAIGKTDLTTALLASTSASSPTMPSGYTLKRRIGSFRTDGSAHILAFVQDGDDFYWATLISDVSASNPGASAVTRTLTVPTGVNVKAYLQASTFNSGAAGGVLAYFSDLATTDSVPTESAPQIADLSRTANIAGNVQTSGGRFYIRTNTSAQIRSRLGFSDASCSLFISTLGWVDTRGRFA
jgi:hypothetical protein